MVDGRWMVDGGSGLDIGYWIPGLGVSSVIECNDVWNVGYGIWDISYGISVMGYMLWVARLGL